MSTKKIFSLIGFIYSIFITAHAQDAWTLSECIEHAKEHNMTIKQQELALQDAAISLSQAKSDYLPTVGIEAKSTTSFRKELAPATYENMGNTTATDITGGITANVDLFAGLKKMYRLQLSKINMLAVNAHIAKAKNDITLGVTAAYLELLLIEENIRIAENKINTLKWQEEKTKQFIGAKTKTQGDLLQVQAQLAEAENDIISIRGQKQKGYLHLCQLLEIENYRDFRIVAPESAAIIELTTTIPEVMDAAQSFPEIAAAQYEVAISGKNIAIARADLYPSLSLSGGYNTSYSDAVKRTIWDDTGALFYQNYSFADQVRNNAGSYLLLSLSFPLFTAFRTTNAIKAKKVAQKRAGYELYLAQKQLSKEVEQLFIDADMAFQHYQSSIVSVRANEEAFKYIEHKLNAGMATFVDYNVAMNNLVAAQSAQVQAKYEYIFKTKVIDFYQGKAIVI